MCKATMHKSATDLSVGDRLVTSIPGHAVFFDRIEHVDTDYDGRIKVRVAGYGGTVFYLPDDNVRVLS